jgi:predicted transcriptional regulator
LKSIAFELASIRNFRQKQASWYQKVDVFNAVQNKDINTRKNLHLKG